jgi:hypothetical protein
LVARAMKQEEGPQQQTDSAAALDKIRIKSTSAPAQFEDVSIYCPDNFIETFLLTIPYSLIKSSGSAKGYLRGRDGFRYHVVHRSASLATGPLLALFSHFSRFLRDLTPFENYSASMRNN